MRWFPFSTVATVVVKDKKFLIVEENIDDHVVYNQPAGHLEANESLQDAAIRETLEETGWQVDLQAIIGVYLYQIDQQTTYQRTCFLATPDQHDASRPLDKPIVQALWLTRDEINALQPQLRSPLVMKCIDDYLQGHYYPLSLLHPTIKKMNDFH